MRIPRESEQNSRIFVPKQELKRRRTPSTNQTSPNLEIIIFVKRKEEEERGQIITDFLSKLPFLLKEMKKRN